MKDRSNKKYDIKGFQLVEVLFAAGLLAVVLGSIIAISVSSTRGINRSADSLLCISLSRYVMELTLSTSFDSIINDNEIYSTYKDEEEGITPGPLFEDFEQLESTSMAIETDLDKALFEQFKALNIRYRVQVTDIGNTNNTRIKQILVSIFWQNGSRSLQYNLAGNIARKIGE